MRDLRGITDAEWLAFWRASRPLRVAWDAVRPYLRARDPRGASRRSFILGWAACEQAYREKFASNNAALSADLEKAFAASARRVTAEQTRMRFLE